MSRQLLIGGALGSPPEIPSESFVACGQSRPGRNGYIIINELLLSTMPWGTWASLRERGARMRVAWDRTKNCLAVSLDSTGDRLFGKMPGWLSVNVLVLDALAAGLVSGRHPARWEEDAVMNGQAVSGWSLVAYPRVILRASGL